MGKFAAFLAGVITGAVALGVTAWIVEKDESDTVRALSDSEEAEDKASTDTAEQNT